jgi:hypothetical protein
MDHKTPPNSMAQFIDFHLWTSQEPGFCLNATRQRLNVNPRPWDDTRPDDNDIKFPPNQANFIIYADWWHNNTTNYDVADSVARDLTATVTVRCLDYGAYGSIDAMADFPDAPMSLARLEGTLNKYQAPIPVDENSNFIADVWQWDYPTALATDDDENNPPNIDRTTGVPTLGDGFSRYEEYRGFRINEAWRELDPTVKNVFVYNPNNFDIAVFRTLGLQIHDNIRTDEFDFVAVQATDNDGDGRVDQDPLDGINNDGDMTTDEDPPDNINPDFGRCTGIVNLFFRTAHIVSQGVIALVYDPTQVVFLGYTPSSLPGRAWSAFGIRAIRIATNPNNVDGIIDARDPAVIRMVVGHEMGHAINMNHHDGATTRQCVMYTTGNSNQDANFNPTPQVYCANNPGDQTRWFLK